MKIHVQKWTFKIKKTWPTVSTLKFEGHTLRVEIPTKLTCRVPINLHSSCSHHPSMLTVQKLHMEFLTCTFILVN